MTPSGDRVRYAVKPLTIGVTEITLSIVGSYMRTISKAETNLDPLLIRMSVVNSEPGVTELCGIPSACPISNSPTASACKLATKETETVALSMAAVRVQIL